MSELSERISRNVVVRAQRGSIVASPPKAGAS